MCAAFLAASLAATGCKDEGTEGQSATGSADVGAPDGGSGDTGRSDVGDAGGDADGQAQGLTYYGGVKAIVDARCATCHFYGGPAATSLTSYQEVSALAPAIKGYVASRMMPPFLAARGCTPYQHDTSLTEEQVDTIVRWVDNGAPEGEPSDQGPALPVYAQGMSRVDVSLTMPEAYLPKQAPDDYRCFPIDWPGQSEQFITGFQVEPGNPRMVHHVIAFYAPPSRVADIEALDAADEGPGYHCFGPMLDPSGLSIGNQNGIGWLGSWAPGGKGRDFPQNTGIPVQPGSKIIVQVHYNVYGGAMTEDQTSVQFKVDDTVEKPAMYLPWTNPRWLNDAQSMKIPAGDSEVLHRWGFDFVSVAGGRALTIYDASLHMHLLGTRGRLHIARGNEQDCMLEIPRWDFGWQQSYRFEEPKRLEAGDRLTVECVYDNSEENQPVLNGTKISPRDVFWGDGTTDEMCLGVFYVTRAD